MNERDDVEARELARRALEWLTSEEGQKTLEESELLIAQTTALFRKGREIDTAELHAPVTV